MSVILQLLMHSHIPVPMTYIISVSAESRMTSPHFFLGVLDDHGEDRKASCGV
jgi:hypothetical protein